MSVVNRMLQDIDRRLGSDGFQPMGAAAVIRSVPPAAAVPPHGRTGRIALLLLCVVAVAVLVWSRWREPSPSPPPGPASSSSMPPAQPLAAAAPAPDVDVVPTLKFELVPSQSIAAAPARITLVETAQAVPVPAPAVAAAPAPGVASAGKSSAPDRVAARSSQETLRLSMQLSAAVPDAPRPRVVRTQVGQGSPAPIRQVAAAETVQAARALWNDGAHAAAAATLREALGVAEPSRDHAATALIGRELARLEIAANRPQAAVDLLRRLEPSLGDDAEALAVRGNAEQRLALHPQAAASYLAALRLRPTEGRWMLGAAISLAAGGDLAAAQAWVDQARERGAVTPPIAAYLQQLGLAVHR